jgi:hypothetical protein
MEVKVGCLYFKGGWDLGVPWRNNMRLEVFFTSLFCALPLVRRSSDKMTWREFLVGSGGID